MADEIENARPKGLLIPFDKLKLLDILDDAAFRQVFRAMAAYVKTGTETDCLEPIEQVAFESMRPFLDENIKTYQRAVIAHREAGRKGGRPKKKEENQEASEETKENQKEPNGFSEEPNETNSPQSTKYKVQSTNDTNVSDTVVVVKGNSVDEDLAKIVRHYQEVAGDFPRSALERLKSWRQTFSTEMILLAIDRAAESNRRSWAYINGILMNWHRDNVHTPGGVAALDEQHQSRQQQGNRAGNARKPAEDVGSQLDRVLAKMDKERGFEP